VALRPLYPFCQLSHLSWRFFSHQPSWLFSRFFSASAVVALWLFFPFNGRHRCSLSLTLTLYRLLSACRFALSAGSVLRLSSVLSSLRGPWSINIAQTAACSSLQYRHRKREAYVLFTSIFMLLERRGCHLYK